MASSMARPELSSSGRNARLSALHRATQSGIPFGLLVMRIKQIRGLQRGKRSHDDVAGAIDPVQIFNQQHRALLPGQVFHERAACIANGAAARLRLQTVPLLIRYRQIQRRIEGRSQDLRQAGPGVGHIARPTVRRRVEELSAANP